MFLKRFYDLSIRLKQTLILMLTSSVALLLACAAFIAYDTVTFRQELVEKETSVAEIVGNASTAALDFSDRITAEQLLGALRAEPNIDAACIYDRNGQVFATYHRHDGQPATAFPPVQAAGHEFTGESLRLFLPIKQGEETVGTIFINSDLTELSSRLARYAGIVGLVFIASLLIALALSSRLQRVVSNPILHLAQVARSVALDKNYSVRAKKKSEDELGQLIDGFNEMLEQIQARDIALETARDNLERRVQERTKELAESLSLLNATIESTNDGIVAASHSGKILTCNTKFTAIWMFPPELLERPDRDLLSAYAKQQVKRPEVLARLVEKMKTDPETERFDTIELKDGRILERYALPQRIDGKCVGVVVNWRDITNRALAENALRESQALYHSLVEQMPTGVFRKDAAGRYVFVNSWFCRLKKLRADEIIGRTPMELAAYELAGRHEQPITATHEGQYAQQGHNHHATIMETGRPIEVDEEYPNGDGTTRFMHVLKSPIFGSEGRITGSQGLLFDITQRRQATEAMALSEERFRSVWERSIEGMRLTDREGRIVDVNEAFCKLVKLPREKLIGQGFNVTYHGHGPNDGIDVYMRRFESESIEPRITARVTLWNSEIVDLEISSSLIESGHQRKMMLSIFRDVTERKRTEEQLKQAQSDLIESSRHAGMAEVASNVLHNVGNVLNSVNVSASLVADGLKRSKAANLAKVVALLDQHTADLATFIASDPKGKRLPDYLRQLGEHIIREQKAAAEELESLQKNIEHIKDIVSMQQSYAKVSGQKEVLNIIDLVEDSLRMNAGALTRHGVRVVREYQEVPPVNVEKHKVLQILVNVIRNAKYACDDGGRLDKQLIVRVSHTQDRVRISVTDNGIGIPAENLTRIFNHGFTTRKSGHGFGLHSGALAAKEMEGSLSVHSEGLHCGATFTLELPVNSPVKS